MNLLDNIDRQLEWLLVAAFGLATIALLISFFIVLRSRRAVVRNERDSEQASQRQLAVMREKHLLLEVRIENKAEHISRLNDLQREREQQIVGDFLRRIMHAHTYRAYMTWYHHARQIRSTRNMLRTLRKSHRCTTLGGGN